MPTCGSRGYSKTKIRPGLLVFPIYVAYNIAYWMPLVLVLTNTLDDATGFSACAVMLAVRAVFHLYRNNLLTAEQAMRFPFRAPYGRNRMKAAICTAYGPPDVLQIRDVPKPTPKHYRCADQNSRRQS